MDAREIEKTIWDAVENWKKVRIVTKFGDEFIGESDGLVNKWDSEDGYTEICLDLGGKKIGLSAGLIETIEIVN